MIHATLVDIGRKVRWKDPYSDMPRIETGRLSGFSAPWTGSPGDLGYAVVQFQDREETVHLVDLDWAQ